MSECAAQVFSNVSPDRFARLTAKGAEEGVPISGPTGTLTHSGATLSWTYDALSQTLTIQCLRAPFLFSCGSVNASIHSLIDSVV